MRHRVYVAMAAVVLLAQPARSQDSPPASGADAGRQIGYNISIEFISPDTGGQATPVTISHGKALFRLLVDGREVWGLLDNRSERSIIDLTLAGALGLEVMPPTGTFLSPLGRVDKRRVSDVPLAIPQQLETKGATVAAVDLQPLSALHGREIGFVLGGDYLALCAMQFDGGRRSLWITPSGAFRGREGLGFATVTPDTNTLEIEIDGVRETVTLDLGLSVPMRVTPARFARLQPDALPTTRAGASRRLSNSIAIADLTVSGVPVEVADADEGAAEISIGLGLFRSANILMDPGAGKFWILPSIAPGTTIERTDP